MGTVVPFPKRQTVDEVREELSALFQQGLADGQAGRLNEEVKSLPGRDRPRCYRDGWRLGQLIVGAKFLAPKKGGKK